VDGAGATRRECTLLSSQESWLPPAISAGTSRLRSDRGLSVYHHLTDAIQRLQDAGVTPADGLPGTADEAFDLEFDATPHLQAKLTTAPI